MSKKILMALMGLEIGGAETHAVELCKELRRRGDEVIVVSNGGVYEKELAEAGVRCYAAPLNRRSIPLMLRSLGILRRVIREERPDVVHAHARIPAFLCGLLQRTMRFPFVTTAHGVFEVNPVLKKLSSWGERTIAVSDDIRDYLVNSYGLPGEQILGTINGIDTQRFSPETSDERIRREFDLPANGKTIVHVSRIDASSTMVTRQLVAIAPRLRERIPGVQLIIAGGGDVFDAISAQADAVNAQAGERIVVMTNARTDINEIIAAGDLFVGVSRAALEAMAEEKPVILAGSQGYIGLFGGERLPLAQESNFCCRGCEMPTEDSLYRDIVHALCDLEEEDRLALGRWGREVVCREYSVVRMTDDCEAAYRQVLAAHTRVVVSGYYGFRNLGDDAILLALRDRLNEILPGASLVALSKRPRETREKCGVCAVDRFNPFAVRRAIKGASVFLSGGGSLLQDHTSTRSLWYYTELIRMAKRLGKPVMFYANGIGPVTDPRNRERVREVSELADVITLRDAGSYDELRAMGVKNADVFITADPVYAMHGGDREAGAQQLRARGIPTDRPILGVSVRFAKGMETNIAEFARFCDSVSGEMTVVFLSLQQPGDTDAAAAVRAKMRRTAYEVSAPYDPQGMMDMLSCMHAVVSTRLHSVIFAACCGVPVLGVVYDPKVSACLDSLGMSAAGTLDGFDADEALAKLHEVLDEREENVKRLCASVDALRARAKENENYFRGLLM